MSDAKKAIFARFAEHELTSRVLSALGLVALALAATAFGGPVFALFWACAATLFLAEFLSMVGYRPLVPGCAVGAAAFVLAALLLQAHMQMLGLAAIGLGMAGAAACGDPGVARLAGAAGVLYGACVVAPVVSLRARPLDGFAMVLWLYAVVWATDIGAFFVGRSLGGPKLWPRISPNKTWSGLIGGTLIGICAAGLVAQGFATLPVSMIALWGLAALASLAAHAGDLLESALKRKYRIKDSSHLIPGHGGFMDRLDGFAFASLVAGLGLWLAG